MTEKIHMGVKIPKDVYIKLKQVVLEKEGALRGYLGRSVEDAIRTKIDLENGDIKIVEVKGEEN